MTVSSLTPDDSVDLRPGRWGWYLTLFATQFHFHTNSRFLSLSLPPQTLSLALQFAPSNTQQRCTPCLCAGCCCLIARLSPSRSSDVVVVCLNCSECVTCICPGSLEGVCFCSQRCKQGGALHSQTTRLEMVIFTGVIFLFIISVNRLAWRGIMC